MVNKMKQTFDVIDKLRVINELDKKLEKHDKWVNLYVQKDGSSHKGLKIHPSEEVALQRFNVCYANAKQIMGDHKRCPYTSYPTQFWNDLAYCVQMPVVE